MEYIEVFSRDGKTTGKIKEKHDRKVPGEYYRHVMDHNDEEMGNGLKKIELTL